MRTNLAWYKGTVTTLTGAVAKFSIPFLLFLYFSDEPFNFQCLLGGTILLAFSPILLKLLQHLHILYTKFMLKRNPSIPTFHSRPHIAINRCQRFHTPYPMSFSFFFFCHEFRLKPYPEEDDNENGLSNFFFS